jgi:hypothetical protein
MIEFDRERLGTALKAGKICADEEKITQIDAWLHTLWFKYRMQTKGYKLGRAKPSRELKNLIKHFLIGLFLMHGNGKYFSFLDPTI